MRSETMKLVKNGFVILLTTALTGLFAYSTYCSRFSWLYPVFSVVSGAIWLFVGNYVGDTKSLFLALRETQKASAALRDELEGYHRDLSRNTKLVEFKQRLFKLFRGPKARLFQTTETVIAFIRKDGGKGAARKYSERADKILLQYGFQKHGLIAIRIATGFTYEKLLEVKRALKEALPDITDVYFVRIPHPSFIMPVNLGKRTRQIMTMVGGVGYSEKDFDRALLAKEIDIQEWIERVPISDFLSMYDSGRYPALKDISLKSVVKYLGLNLGTLDETKELDLYRFFLTKRVSEADALPFAQQLAQTFVLISNFVRIVEDHTFEPK